MAMLRIIIMIGLKSWEVIIRPILILFKYIAMTLLVLTTTGACFFLFTPILYTIGALSGMLLVPKEVTCINYSYWFLGWFGKAPDPARLDNLLGAYIMGVITLILGGILVVAISHSIKYGPDLADRIKTWWSDNWDNAGRIAKRVQKKRKKK